MPRTIELPPRPELVYGVWNSYGNLARPDDPDYLRVRHTPGWRVSPYYGIGGGPIESSADELAENLLRAEGRWLSKCSALKRSSARMDEVLVGRVITRIEVSFLGVYLYLQGGGRVLLDRTRGFNQIVMDGPRQGPFSVTRILATHRTFRLDNGESLVFNTKMQMVSNSIPDWILADIFGA